MTLPVYPLSCENTPSEETSTTTTTTTTTTHFDSSYNDDGSSRNYNNSSRFEIEHQESDDNDTSDGILGGRRQRQQQRQNRLATTTTNETIERYVEYSELQRMNRQSIKCSILCVAIVSVVILIIGFVPNTNNVSVVVPINATNPISLACHFLRFRTLEDCQQATIASPWSYDVVPTTITNNGTTNATTMIGIPTEIGLLTNLTELRLDSANLKDTMIPSTIGNLVQLTYLGLSSTGLIGTIPTTIDNLIQLSSLLLNDNPRLTGIIPRSLCQSSEAVTNITIVIDCPLINCSCCVSGVDSVTMCSNVHS